MEVGRVEKAVHKESSSCREEEVLLGTCYNTRMLEADICSERGGGPRRATEENTIQRR